MAKRLRDTREDADDTQKTLGDLLGVSGASVSKYESGAAELSCTSLLQICERYGKSPNYMLGWENENMVSLDGLDAEERKQVIGLINLIKKNKK